VRRVSRRAASRTQPGTDTIPTTPPIAAAAPSGALVTSVIAIRAMADRVAEPAAPDG
jgi:hypothetical protein